MKYFITASLPPRRGALLAAFALPLLAVAVTPVKTAWSKDNAHQNHHAAPATKTDYYAAAMNKMHQDMHIEITGDADIDFMRGMIPHHEGAVAMAEIVLEHGKDPAIRKLAEEIIAAQEREIAFMKEWLAQHDR